MFLTPNDGRGWIYLPLVHVCLLSWIKNRFKLNLDLFWAQNRFWLNFERKNRFGYILDQFWLWKWSFEPFLIFYTFFRTVPIIVEKLQEAKHNAKGISSAMLQDERSKVMKDLKNFKIRVLVSSDLVSRKILIF
jgi:superfamily II DNA/RNA helicase